MDRQYSQCSCLKKSSYTNEDFKFLPMVGIVVTISPNLSLYRMVVFPAASNPTIKIRISFLPKRPLNNVAKTFPILIKSEDLLEQKTNLKVVR